MPGAGTLNRVCSGLPRIHHLRGRPFAMTMDCRIASTPQLRVKRYAAARSVCPDAISASISPIIGSEMMKNSPPVLDEISSTFALGGMYRYVPLSLVLPPSHVLPP